MSADLPIPDEIASRTSRLINEIEDARKAANDDLKQAYADLREELKSLGWNGSHISQEVAALKGAIAETRLDDEAKAKREEKGDRVDLYVGLIRSPARARARTREATITPDPQVSGDDDGHPSVPSSDDAGAKNADHLPYGRAPEEGGVYYRKSEQESDSAAQDRNEPVSASWSSVPHSQFSRAPVKSVPLHEQADVKTERSYPREAASGALSKVQSPAQTGCQSNSASPHLSSSREAANFADEVGQSSTISPAFSNPRCREPGTCDFAHSRDCCHDCLLAWGSRPRDEQRRLWQEADRAAQGCEAA